MKNLLFFGGIAAALMGALWIAQGLGIFPYPASSMMIGQRNWSVYGLILVVVGVAAAFVSRRY